MQQLLYDASSVKELAKLYPPHPAPSSKTIAFRYLAAASCLGDLVVQRSALTAFSILLAHRSDHFPNSCSQIRITVQPRRRSWRLTKRSRAMLARILAVQNARPVLSVAEGPVRLCERDWRDIELFFSQRAGLE